MKYSVLAMALALLVQAGGGVLAEELSRNWVRFQVWSPDSVALYGSYYPAQHEAGPVALLLHDRGGEGHDLALLASWFQRDSIPTFLPDLRGEGRSIESRQGRVTPAARWGVGERRLLLQDMRRVLSFADSQETLLGRDWVLVAVGEAAALAFELAEEMPRFKRLALLSPRLSDEIQEGTLSAARRVLLLACDEDLESVTELRRLYERLPVGSRRMDLLPCRARGARILLWSPDMDLRLKRWAVMGGQGP